MNTTAISWMDPVILAALLGSIALGARQGFLRQLLLLISLYAGAAVAALYHEPVARIIVQSVPGSPLESARAIAFLIVGLAFAIGITWLSWFAYGNTKLPGTALVDTATGALLGGFVGVFVISMGLMMAHYAADSGLVDAGSIRYGLRLALSDSLLDDLFRVPLPAIRTVLSPWLPSEVSWVLGS